MRILVIGSGIFGSSIAIELSKANFNVTLIDEDKEIMKHASMNNHNRLHLGYHYLRSVKTAEQSIEGLISFLFYYGKSVYHSFPNYYAIAKDGSQTTSTQFTDFCDEVGIDYDFEFPGNNLLDPDKLDSCFKVPEPIYDFFELKEIINEKLEKHKINVQLGVKCIDIKHLDNGKFDVLTSSSINKNVNNLFDVVINATYSNINDLNKLVNIKPYKLLYENVIIPIFELNKEPFGLTIMDGPFCSVMPRGKSSNQFLLYHVKQSVINSYLGFEKPNWDLTLENENNVFRESIQYMPFLRDVKHLTNYRCIRTVRENKDDARLSELFTYEEIPNFFTVLSGKITTCVQVALQIKHQLQGKNTIKRKRI